MTRDLLVIIKYPMDMTQEEVTNLAKLLEADPKHLIIPEALDIVVIDRNDASIIYKLERKEEPQKKKKWFK